MQERSEILRNLLKAKRHCFIEIGLTHPNFLELFLSVTTLPQQAKVQGAISLLFRSTLSTWHAPPTDPFPRG